MRLPVHLFSLGRVGMVLAFAVLMLRSVVPSGWMLAETPSKPFEIVICTASGAMTIADDLGERDETPKDSKDGTCLFTALAKGAPPLAALALDVTYAGAALWCPPSADAAPGRGLAAPPPPATGPPTLI